MITVRHLLHGRWCSKTMSSLFSIQNFVLSNGGIQSDTESKGRIMFRCQMLINQKRFVPMSKPFAASVGYRYMSAVRGKSLRSRVEERMRRETGKTLNQIRRTQVLKKKLMSDEERLVYNLRRAKKKVSLLLQKLKKFEMPEIPPPRHDPELLTREQSQAFKKIGFSNKNYVPVGVRGVFGGVVQNMHMHWKFHETVQVCCDNFPKEKIKEMASMLARLSGGIVINIHNGKTIIMFRGRNYRQPKNLIPINTLTKRKALFKARFEQALETQKLNIKKYEQELRWKGVNPEDLVAMASIQRVASTFFNAIDKRDGNHDMFLWNKDPTKESSNYMEQLKVANDSDQEELDSFIAHIEDAAEREFADEEAAAKGEVGRIKYLNREHSRGRYRKFDMPSDVESEDENQVARNHRHRWGTQTNYSHLTCHGNAAAADDDEEYDSDKVSNETEFETDINDSDGAANEYGESLGGIRGNTNVGEHDHKFKDAEGTLAEEDSGSGGLLSDLEDVMWKSDSDPEHEGDGQR